MERVAASLPLAISSAAKGSCYLQVAARAIVLSEEQLAAGHAIQSSYVQQLAACQAERKELLKALQTAAAPPGAGIPELSAPNQAVAISSDMRRLSISSALQQEAYLHLTRSFVLHVLTPFDAGLLMAASHPYLVEFGAIMQHLLTAASNRAATTGQGS